MTREQARKLFEESRRFENRNGRVVVRDMALAEVITAIKAERSSHQLDSAIPPLAAFAA